MQPAGRNDLERPGRMPPVIRFECTFGDPSLTLLYAFRRLPQAENRVLSEMLVTRPESISSLPRTMFADTNNRGSSSATLRCTRHGAKFSPTVAGSPILLLLHWRHLAIRIADVRHILPTTVSLLHVNLDVFAFFQNCLFGLRVCVRQGVAALR